MKSKLIYISAVDSRENTGQASFERNFLKFLEEKGHERFKHIFVISPNYAALGKTTAPSIVRAGKSFKAQFIYQLKASKFLWIFLSKHHKDAKVFIRESGIMLLPLLISRLFGVKVVTRSGPGSANLKDYGHTQNPLVIWTYRIYLKFFYLFVNHVTVVTNGIKKTLVNNYNILPDRITVIPNPANDALFSRVPIEKKERHGDIYNFGYVGSVSEFQRVQDIVQAVKILHEEGEIDCALFKVWIIGDGSYWIQINELIEENGLNDYFEITGNVNQTQLSEYYQQIDCAIAPYSHRFNNLKGSSALKVVEYLYNQKYILAADIEDYRYLADEGFGELFEIENPKDLAVHMLDIYSQRKTQQGDSRHFVITQRSSDSTFNRYLDEIIKA